MKLIFRKIFLLLGKHSFYHRLEFLLKNPAYIGVIFKNRILGYKVLLVIRKGGAGDIICTLPMVDEIKLTQKRKAIVYQTLAANLEIPQMSQSIDLTITDSEADTYWMNYFLQPSEILNPLLPPEKNWSFSLTSKHLVEHLAESCGFESLSCKQSFLVPKQSARKAIKKILETKKLDISRLAVIHVGATWAVKEWPLIKWEQLAKRLRDNLNLQIVQVGHDFTASASDRACQRVPGVVDLVGKLTFQETAALLETSRLFIGVDSGVLHLAGAVRTPIIGIFGPTNPFFYLPRISPAIGITANVECLGCQHAENGCLHWKTGCPNNIICMNEITPEDVYQAVQKILSTNYQTELSTL